MKSVLRVVVLAGLVAGAALSAACATSINRVLADPSRYRNRDVKISGVVADSYSIANRGVYRVRDGSGQLWVVSERGVPRNGARVSVKGTVREGFNLGSLGNVVRLPPGVGSGLMLLEISHKASR